MTVAIINYGMGNLRSVQNAFEALGATATVAASPSALSDASHIVLPGVGAFPDAMRNLRSGGWLPALEKEVREKGKPFLGLCLGMQLLATTGTEFETCAGLGWIPGTVERLEGREPDVRVPHIGWNDARFVRKDGLFAGLGDAAPFYFVHSYAFRPSDEIAVAARCVHGADFVAAVEVGNLHATQFHPEKSQKAGLAVLRNFLKKGA